ncbi:MAG: DUF2007 domain-containing protein [Candidatus Cyclonatronum sp.]|uniref:putative signal transducing protein n=1 Tax=Cyclonatronum sp. TaxID=3024185 RepID=UPI0025C20874|nr:DUF2007 domain-containing protein [Cyclonatronum sp.]MCC5934142.1 DUF2007 domain-containing protein [Balneolales bacterium]MCH8486259.1 DUF2007 domain-containing protein [Cyclonatronum sp.]
MFGNDPKPSEIKDWTCVFDTNQEFEAEMMKNFLDDRGFEAQILSKKDSAYSVNHSQLSLLYVYVPDDKADDARAAIREFEDGELIDEFPDGED